MEDGRRVGDEGLGGRQLSHHVAPNVQRKTTGAVALNMWRTHCLCGDSFVRHVTLSRQRADYALKHLPHFPPFPPPGRLSHPFAAHVSDEQMLPYCAYLSPGSISPPLPPLPSIELTDLVWQEMLHTCLSLSSETEIGQFSTQSRERTINSKSIICFWPPLSRTEPSWQQQRETESKPRWQIA